MNARHWLLCPLPHEPIQNNFQFRLQFTLDHQMQKYLRIFYLSFLLSYQLFNADKDC